MKPALKGVVVGAGYFSRFHYDAWSRLEEAKIVACCDLDAEKARGVAADFDIERTYTDAASMLDAEHPDFVDIVTPPATHAELLRVAAERGVDVICQKPLAPSIAEARAMVESARHHGIRFVVHENFRFQPWYREIRSLLDASAIGTKLHSLTFRSRPGDGWGADAYLGRQPYFRDMPRLLIYETGIHAIDTFRFLAGEIVGVTAFLRRLNPVIRGEDAGLVVFQFESGALGVYDANRYNQSTAADPRYTFGELLVEADGGTIRLADDGGIMVQPLGKQERPHLYHHEHRGFAADCCFATQAHIVRSLIDGKPAETEATAYLQNLAVQEATYLSAKERRSISIERETAGEIDGREDHPPTEQGA